MFFIISEILFCADILKNILIHNTCERAHLLQVLPDLYEEYKDKPLDAD